MSWAIKPLPGEVSGGKELISGGKKGEICIPKVTRARFKHSVASRPLLEYSYDPPPKKKKRGGGKALLCTLTGVWTFPAPPRFAFKTHCDRVGLSSQGSISNLNVRVLHTHTDGPRQEEKLVGRGRSVVGRLVLPMHPPPAPVLIPR